VLEELVAVANQTFGNGFQGCSNGVLSREFFVANLVDDLFSKRLVLEQLCLDGQNGAQSRAELFFGLSPDGIDFLGHVVCRGFETLHFVFCKLAKDIEFWDACLFAFLEERFANIHAWRNRNAFQDFHSADY